MVAFSVVCLYFSSTENIFKDSKMTSSGISLDNLPAKVASLASSSNFLLCSSLDSTLTTQVLLLQAQNLLSSQASHPTWPSCML